MGDPADTERRNREKQTVERKREEERAALTRILAVSAVAAEVALIKEFDHLMVQVAVHGAAQAEARLQGSKRGEEEARKREEGSEKRKCVAKRERTEKTPSQCTEKNE